MGINRDVVVNISSEILSLIVDDYRTKKRPKGRYLGGFRWMGVNAHFLRRKGLLLEPIWT